jgi:hypothetical protein
MLKFSSYDVQIKKPNKNLQVFDITLLDNYNMIIFYSDGC